MRVLMGAMTKGKVRFLSSGTHPGPTWSLPSGPDLQSADMVTAKCHTCLLHLGCLSVCLT
jgi:hypothetical protein